MGVPNPLERERLVDRYRFKLLDELSVPSPFAGVAVPAYAEQLRMAAGIGFDGIPAAAFSVLILLFGHSLNLLLCVFAVLVHGVRLNTLEFSSHKGVSWSGFICP